MRGKQYVGESIDVYYDVSLCVHAAECVRGLPEVFDTKRKPWILPDGAEAPYVATVIERCPSGALQFVRKDGEDAGNLGNVRFVTIVVRVKDERMMGDAHSTAFRMARYEIDLTFDFAASRKDQAQTGTTGTAMGARLVAAHGARFHDRVVIRGRAGATD